MKSINNIKCPRCGGEVILVQVVEEYHSLKSLQYIGEGISKKADGSPFQYFMWVEGDEPRYDPCVTHTHAECDDCDARWPSSADLADEIMAKQSAGRVQGDAGVE